ncbi:ATP-dependent RNA helicase [marine gamma proteobacterium HTCC2080]|nr:ATP-dependent RNA helicase [marine gamma proteobacterium HTCC2080]
MSTPDTQPSRFNSLGLPDFLQENLQSLGYETATPIQAGTIPLLLEGRDVVGLAQTGTGKTAAFALPILANIDVKVRSPQALVLCPTRELAQQVAEAFRSYGRGMGGLRILSIFGGADMRQQLKSLREGTHIVVATPGRLLDHIERRSIDLTGINAVVLDEADEMLRMGFIDDVDTILAKTPKERKVALFSATMPKRVRDIANKHLSNPAEISVAAAATTNENIEQCYWLAKGASKLEALKRLLAFEDTEGVIVFTRTRESTTVIAEQLRQTGLKASPLNGDMDQKMRLRTVSDLKSGALDVLVATDVAARGLDVERITHVINYDVPFDEEAYVHRIGRTGRAGRKGKAILFVVPRERRMLRNIERLTRQSIPEIKLPSVLAIDAKRREAFADSIRTALADPMQAELEEIIDTLNKDSDYRSIAVALAGMLHSPGASKGPKHAKGEKHTPYGTRDARDEKSSKPNRKERRQGLQKKAATSESETPSAPKNEKHLGEARPLRDHPDVPMERFRVEVGRKHGVKPGELMGAIANEAGIEGQYIGMINILEECSTIDLPEGIPKSILKHLKKTRVKGVHLAMGRVA